jgi:nucleoside-diphosphate-sugar epimerase
MTYRILITAGVGFIGSFLADYFLACDDTILLLDNLDPQVHPQICPTYANTFFRMRLSSFELVISGIVLQISVESIKS